MSNEFEKFIQQHQQAFNTASPSNKVLEMLQQNMVAVDKKKQRKLAVVRFIKFASVACIITVACFSVFILDKNSEPSIANSATNVNQLPKREVEENVIKKSLTKVDTVEKTPQEKTSNHGSIIVNKYIAQLQNMDAPSKRYNAAIEIVQAKEIDKEVINALTNCLNNDPNTNVRLAALESLSTFYKEPLVKKKLLESLGKQKDPIVKMSLIDVLTKLRVSNLRYELERIINDVHAPKPVKDQANQSIHTLSL
ncbi:MAG: HEAT repeat domain-containing protein [Chitinophagaceae bacterium]